METPVGWRVFLFYTMPRFRRSQNPAQALMETDLVARLYESLLWRRNPLLTLLLGSSFQREARMVSRALELAGTETVLDLACGPGIYARRFAGEASRGTVIGVDLSLPMLEHGRTLLEGHGIANVRLLQGDALTLPFGDARFDVVNCAAALHLFGELARTLAEVSRVLKPGGRFTFSTFRYPGSRLMQRFLHLRDNRVGIRSFRQEEIESQLLANGFHEIRYLFAGGIWVVMKAIKIA